MILLPFVLIRFALLYLLDKKAIKRAAYFPTMVGNEIIAYYLYQFSNIAIFIYLIFVEIKPEQSYFFYIGILAYILGLILCIISIINFATPLKSGINQRGLYRFSRNPMYLSYFIYFIGCTLISNSLVFFALVLLFQVSSHWIILSEERWCIHKFGEEYIQYMKKVRRYI